MDQTISPFNNNRILDRGNMTIVLPAKYKEKKYWLASKKDLNNLTPGFIYSLQPDSCEGIQFSPIEYLCVKVLKTFKGEPLNSVVMKQLTEDGSTIFSLTRNDCSMLNIDYEPGLQIFPIKYAWKFVRDSKTLEERNVFDPDDLSSLPKNSDGKVFSIDVQVSKIRRMGSDAVLVSKNLIIPKEIFLQTVQFKFKDKEKFSDNQLSHVVDPKLNKGLGCFVFTLYFPSSDPLVSGGLDPNKLKGLHIEDLIEMSWYEPPVTNNMARKYRGVDYYTSAWNPAKTRYSSTYFEYLEPVSLEKLMKIL